MQEISDFGDDADLKQAITDLGVEYGLVTDYTAMVVVRNEVFDSHGIERSNQARRTAEELALLQRAQRPAVSRRVDSQQPMYSSNRASHSGSGSGALDAWTLLLLLPLAWLTWRRRYAPGSS
jgi:Ca-activated chloride channel family protein